MSKVVIFGEGKMADEVYFYLTHDSEYEVVAFTVDRDYMTKKELFGLPIIPFEDIVAQYPPSEFKMFVAIGYQQLNQLRAQKYFEAKEKGYELVSYICSKASNFGQVEVGDNCLVLENTVLQPLTSIGNNVFLWSGNLIGHHSSIEDHCFLAGQVVISGNTIVKPYCFIGVNATVGHEITIGEKSLIGAGTLVTKSTESESVYIVPDTPKYRLNSEYFIRMTRL